MEKCISRATTLVSTYRGAAELSAKESGGSFSNSAVPVIGGVRAAELARLVETLARLGARQYKINSQGCAGAVGSSDDMKSF